MTEAEKQNHFIASISGQRMNRYLVACAGDKARAIALYRANVRLGVECFCMIGHFEIVMRNAIDRLYLNEYGPNWLFDAIQSKGMYASAPCRQTNAIIQTVMNRLQSPSHADLVAALDFGFWRYQFAGPQFGAAGRKLLRVFPGKPASNKQQQYDHTYVFRRLEIVNEIRNRIAHHEPLCFAAGSTRIDLTAVTECIAVIDELMQWMQIDASVILGDRSGLTAVIGEVGKF